jgi:hypothetical protein
MGDQQDAPRAADRTSHGADALRYGVMAAHERMKTLLDDVIPPAEDKRLAVLWPSDPATQRGVTLDELFEYSEGGERPGSRQRI